MLWKIFHVALWDPPPAPLRPIAILDRPDVRIYAEDWGHREGDVGVVAEVEGEFAGACWMRRLEGGFVQVDVRRTYLIMVCELARG